MSDGRYRRCFAGIATCGHAILFLVAVVFVTGACHNSGRGSNEKWNMVGGDGVRNSWDDGTDNFEEVRVLQVHQGRLYAGLVNPSQVRGEVWEYDGASWRRVGGDGLMAVRNRHERRFVSGG